MSEAPAVVRDGMLIQFDVAIAADDGAILRADVPALTLLLAFPARA
jgi:hypothetical protein